MDPAFWRSLGPKQCLRCDYKEFTLHGKKIGCSSVLLPVLEFFGSDPEKVTEACESFLRAKELDALVVLSLSMRPEVQREILLLTASTEMTDRLVRIILASETLDAHEENLPEPVADATSSAVSVRWFHQNNIRASRKQFVPAIDAGLAMEDE